MPALWKNITQSRNFLLGSAFLFVFVIFSYTVGLNLLSGSDIFLTQSLQNIIPRFLDMPLSTFSLIGTFEVTTAILIILLSKSKLTQEKMAILLAGFILVLFIEVGFKNFFQHPQPPAIYNRYDLPINLPTSNVELRYAYPSGHIGRTTFLVVLAWFLLATKNKSQNKKLGYSLLAFGFVMVLSRVYLGEHWATDVVGGALLGGSLATLSWSVITPKAKN